MIVVQSKVNPALKDLLKKFKYYRLSLYTFSMASLVEIMLSGNFKEENTAGIKMEIGNLSMAYREAYGQCSLHLEKMSDLIQIYNRTTNVFFDENRIYLVAD